MTQGEPKITLMNYLGMVPMRQVVKTRLFGGPYIRFYDFLSVSLYLYESGAILGRAKRDKLMILAKMIIDPGKAGRESEFIELLQQQAKKRLEKFGKEPTSFFMFFLSTELEKVGLSLTGSSIKTLKKAFDEKWPLNEETETPIEARGPEGIGFGSYFPELTEKMYRNFHENIGTDAWSEARAYGLSLPEKPTIISLEEQEETVLSMVASYASEYFPELIRPLGLS
jgi:hypothetical protein